MTRTPATFLFLATLLGGTARADDRDAATVAKHVASEIEQYDKNHGGNTIPLEEDVIRLRDLRATAELAPVLAHERFALLGVWALADIGDAASAPAVVAAFRKCTDSRARKEMAPAVAVFGTAEVRAALREQVKAAKAEDRDAYRAALLRAGDADLEKEVLAALASNDAAAIGPALVLAGDSRREDLFVHFGKFASDTRPAPARLKTAFAVEVQVPTDNGVKIDRTYPALRTLQECAVEAASRSVTPITPGMVAWWYESEISPRFVQGADGAAAVAAAAKAIDAAVAAKALPMRRAVAAVIASLPGKDRPKLRIKGVTFGQGWEVQYVAAGKTKTATVDGEGKVGTK